MSDTNESLPPKVFISYSWTNEEHTEWVAELAEKLLADGIDVVLDQWSLEDGQDLNSFMEQMVHDVSIKRVLIICDRKYAEKANERTGGVGTETQIISQKVYESVDQNKFVPILRERYEDGKACLPTYLESRRYIDFSDGDKEPESYDRLVRNIFERPARPKPPLGASPSHLFEDEPVCVTSARKAKQFRETVASGKGNPSAAFQDFTSEFLKNLEELRLTYEKEKGEEWCEELRENISRSTAHRDVFIDVVYCGAAYLPGEQFRPLVVQLFEQISPFRERPAKLGSYFKCSEDNYKFLFYELFLYSFAAFVKAGKHDDARKLIDHQYVCREFLDSQALQPHGYSGFNEYNESLDGACAREGDRRRLSVSADLVKERATRQDLRLSDVIQADVILWLEGGGRGWYPRTLIYVNEIGKLELFLRAVNEDGVTPLLTLLKLSGPQKLIELLCSKEVQNVWNSTDIAFHARATQDCLNVSELHRRWSSSQI